MSSGRRSVKSTSILVALISLLVGVGQHYGWFNQAAKQAQTTQPGLYRVVEFIDGDTIQVDMLGQPETIRMIGVDTPETHDPRKPVECFGQAASAFTKQLIGSQPVRLEADSLDTNRDRYNRLLRYVYLPDGRLVNAEIIKQGYGFAYIGFPFEKLEDFRTYEADARQSNKGLWSGCQPYFDAKGYLHSNAQN